MNPTHLELAQIQANVLYMHNANGKLLRINESDPEGPAPRFFLMRTAGGNLWRTRYGLPDDLAAKLEQLAAQEPVSSELNEQPLYAAQYAELLQQHEAISSTYAGPAYYLPTLDMPTGTLTITRENDSLLQRNFPYTLSVLEERAPVVVVVADGVAVAACYSARSTPPAAEAGVDTMEAHRGRGYAAQTVRGWSAAVRKSGRIPLYSTSWDNTASRSVASKLGAVLYGVDFNIT